MGETTRREAGEILGDGPRAQRHRRTRSGPALTTRFAWCLLVHATGTAFSIGGARADTAEGSIRPLLEARHGATLTTDAGQGEATAVGGGVMVTYGLSFSWSVSAVYQLDATPVLETPDPSDPFQRVRRWRSVRHATRMGLAWTLSDELTPVLLLEAGAVLLRTSGARSVRRADGRTEASLPARQRILPTGRATALYEWRFTDFWGIAAGGFIEYSGSIGYGAQFWLATYRYL